MAFPVEGGCTCRAIRYRMERSPLLVHCCHCSWCQRETGSAFAVNAMIEAGEFNLLSGDPETILTPSLSGRGQEIARCPTCRVAVWSHYGAAGPQVKFVRVGTLDDPDSCPPDVHIYTSTKRAWVVLPQGAKVFEEFYPAAEVWPAETMARYRKAIGR